MRITLSFNILQTVSQSKILHLLIKKNSILCVHIPTPKAKSEDRSPLVTVSFQNLKDLVALNVGHT